MKLTRLIVIVVLFTVILAGVGAGVGFLVGYGAPAAMGEFLDVEHHNKFTVVEGNEGGNRGATVDVRELPSRGAAICAAIGLGAGAGVGLIVGIIDQILLVIRNAIQAKKGEA